MAGLVTSGTTVGRAGPHCPAAGAQSQVTALSSKTACSHQYVDLRTGMVIVWA